MASVDGIRGPHWSLSKVLCSHLGHPGHTERGSSRGFWTNCITLFNPSKVFVFPPMRTKYLSLLLQPGSYWLAVPSSSYLAGYPTCTSGVFYPAAEALCLVFTPCPCLICLALCYRDPCAHLLFLAIDLSYKDRLSCRLPVAAASGYEEVGPRFLLVPSLQTHLLENQGLP